MHVGRNLDHREQISAARLTRQAASAGGTFSPTKGQPYKGSAALQRVRKTIKILVAFLSVVGKVPLIAMAGMPNSMIFALSIRS
jgi:hypothetical protein